MTITSPVTSLVIEQIHRHASVRKYKADPVAGELIEAIVAAGQRASTSSNLQMYAVVAVTQPEKRAELARLCGNQAHILRMLTVRRLIPRTSADPEAPRRGRQGLFGLVAVKINLRLLRNINNNLTSFRYKTGESSRESKFACGVSTDGEF